MAADTPLPYLGIPIEVLRVHAGFLSTDATHDAEIDVAFQSALECVELYLDRKLTSADYVDVVTHFNGTSVSLAAYPLQSIDDVVIEPDGFVPPYHADMPIGLLRLDGHFVAHKLSVSYAGGYVEAPGPVKMALLATFDAVWESLSSTGSAGAVGKEVKATVVDGMRVEYFDPNAGSGSSSATAFGFIPGAMTQMLELFRRKLV